VCRDLLGSEMFKPLLIPGEDKPWHCPNCGLVADASFVDMKHRVINCHACKAKFEVLLYWPLTMPGRERTRNEATNRT
jgi:hypothetical protein